MSRPLRGALERFRVPRGDFIGRPGLAPRGHLPPGSPPPGAGNTSVVTLRWVPDHSADAADAGSLPRLVPFGRASRREESATVAAPLLTGGRSGRGRPSDDLRRGRADAGSGRLAPWETPARARRRPSQGLLVRHPDRAGRGTGLVTPCSAFPAPRCPHGRTPPSVPHLWPHSGRIPATPRCRRGVRISERRILSRRIHSRGTGPVVRTAAARQEAAVAATTASFEAAPDAPGPKTSASVLFPMRRRPLRRTREEPSFRSSPRNWPSSSSRPTNIGASSNGPSPSIW